MTSLCVISQVNCSHIAGEIDSLNYGPTVFDALSLGGAIA